MILRRILFLMAVSAMAVLTNTPLASAQVFRTRSFGCPGTNIAQAIAPTADGNFIVAGDSLTVIREYWYYLFYHAHLYSVAPDGTLLWTRTLDWKGSATAIAPAGNRSFLVAAGTIDTSSLEGNDVCITKIEQSGNLLWTKVYNWQYRHWPTAIAVSRDGDFVITASTYPASDSGQRCGIKVLMMDSGGDTTQSKEYVFAENRDVSALSFLPNGNLLAAGYIDFGQVRRPWLLCLGAHGDTVWSYTPDLAGFEAGAIVLAGDSDFVAAGFGGTAGNEAFALKMTTGGKPLWMRKYAGITGPLSIFKAGGGGFMLCGAASAKIDSEGNAGWIMPASGPTPAATAMYRTATGDFVAAEALGPGGTVFRVLDDRYAKKDSLFTFEIPEPGDSLAYSYSPLSLPAQCGVSAGGTIFWTPRTDSAFVTRIAVLVTGDTAADTCSFNLFVNCSQGPNRTVLLPDRMHPGKPALRATSLPGNSLIAFSFPVREAVLRIFDIRGRLVASVRSKNGEAVLGDRLSQGRYFATVEAGSWTETAGFVVVK
jgi:hypothetical protein